MFSEKAPIGCFHIVVILKKENVLVSHKFLCNIWIESDFVNNVIRQCVIESNNLAQTNSNMLG